jgi:xylulose-5-phosphate/fructose-6-phosphate phosphoketolase
MVVRNRVSRYHLVLDALNNATRQPSGAADLRTWCEQKLLDHAAYIVEHLEDLPEVQQWTLTDDPDRKAPDLGSRVSPARQA